MLGLRNNGGSRLHRGVAELADGLLQGRLDRREFLRSVSWLGVSAASASAFAASVLGAKEASAAVETPKRGGSLRFASVIQELSDPSTVAWIESSNLFRNSLEFLTRVDADNVTHPYLAESWEPSEDLKTWRFKLRQGITWSDGVPFTSADVAYTIKRWIAPDSKSSNKTSFASVQDVEIVGPHEVVLHLSRPMLALPQMLFAYTCPILPRDFDATGANWPKHPVGTGPYTMTHFAVGQGASFKRRADYWGTAPYLDEIHFIDLGADISAQVAALAAGQVDILYKLSIEHVDLVKRIPNAVLLTGSSAQTLCLRMQVDQKPFDDIRIRRAVQLSANNKQMLDLAYRGQGTVSQNDHVSPIQPEYFALPPMQRDVAQARALLKEAGYPDGIDIKLVLGNTQGRYEQDTAQVLQQNCREAGIRIALDVLPATEYWPIWNKVPFGVTYWAHRPLAVMTLDLAYRSGAAWNETHFNSPAFDAALDHASAILDPHERSKAMQAVEQILRDNAVMVQPYFPAPFTATAKNVHGYKLNPADYFDLFTVWLS